MCARFQSSHVQTPADRQSRAHPPRPIHARDGSMPQAQLLRRSLSPNRRGRRLVSRAWTARPLDAGVPPAPRRLGYLPCPLRLKPFHRAERAAQPLHFRSRAPRLLPPLRFLREPRNPTATAISARELFSGKISRHRPPPPDPPHPEPPLDVTRRPRAFPGEPDASPTSPPSSRRATNDSKAFTEPLRVAFIEHRRPRREAPPSRHPHR